MTRNFIFLNRFFHPDHSATSQLLSDLAFSLAGEGLDVHIITGRQGYGDPGARLPAGETVRGVRIHRVWTTRFGRRNLVGRTFDYMTFYASAAWRLWRLARRGDVVVAKTDPPLISVVATRVGRFRTAILVNWVQDLFPEVASASGVYGMKGWFASQLCRLRNASLRFARMNVVVGEGMATQLVREGIADDRVQVIHNWADGMAIRPQNSSENPLRQEWDLADKFVVGYSGNMGRAHEFETMLDAAELLNEQAQIVFLFIGDGAQRAWVEERVKTKGLQNILFRPYQPRESLAQSLTVPDVHLISLRPELEGLMVPSKFYGIAAAGRPVIYVGDSEGEIGTIIQDANCGVAIPQGDPASLAAQVRKLDSKRDLCCHMGRNARAVFEQRFERRSALSAWKQLLSEV
ncbi:MAG: glycosyltransferase family 4 protein [Gammaproteobacteria bacterium]|nr:glycosyltransferase family 4 protein [Gammaproteobacteria bacterium]